MHLFKKYLPYIALATAAVIWGANTPIMKVTMLSVPLFSLAFLRFFIAALLLLPFVYKSLLFKRNDWFSLFLCAFLGVTVLITLYFLGLRMTSALNAGIIGGTMPIVALIFAAIFLHEKMTKKIIIGATIGLTGILVIVGKDMFVTGLDISPMGDMLIFLSNIAFAAYITLSKKLSKRYAPLTLTFFVFFVGGLFFLPGAIMDLNDNPTWFINMPIFAYIGVLYGIIFSALIAFALWQYGLSKVSETNVGFFLYISPIITSFIAITFLGEHITEEFLIGTLLIFIGLLVAEAHLHHKKPLHH
ncbi:MAG: DMT family transporter [Candidatus Levybacteria bacterium]|nr:DMT family transporter [Candidatus Levybacteria bacterium]